MLSFTIQPARPFTPQPLASFHQWLLPDGTLWLQFYRIPTGYLLRFTNLADFEVSTDGQTICCWPGPETSASTIEHLYLNQILPLALGQQGKLIFHASAVEIGDVAVAFMGASGRGKSTLAATFATTGLRFLADDGLLVEPHEGHYQVIPSHPSIRLWQDSEQALIPPDAIKATPVQFTSKSRFLSGQEVVFCEQPRPLKQIYLLGEGITDQLVCQRIRPAVACIELVKHAFILDSVAATLLTNQFATLSQITQQIPCYRLDYPRSFATVTAIKQAIINHVTDEVQPYELT
ncbi:MAG: hypothetical protein DYG89_16025 [Caldilinea sp. CFX5]|nr:hypothetical protein [Caldilinea sp. CFX5]